ncbi:unnamed protein product [Rhizoctonia solani]|uniref:CUE domain-containing protein n=1 Tax=Rhizoctonia solani TaxID=456999 RepID=A0A8H3C951_9AGAM|nr:unnamed protein product [Rhizoctonia solani]
MATVDTLPIFPIHELKDSVPYERYVLITHQVAHKLGSILESATSSKGLQTQSLVGFLSSYLSDVARQVLVQSSTRSGSLYTDSLSESERVIRKCTLRIISLIASQQADLPVTLLIDLAIVYFPLNNTSLQNIFNQLLSVSPRASEFESTVIPAFTSALVPKHPDVIELREIAYTLRCITSCGNRVKSLFAQQQSFVKALAECYQTVLPNLIQSLGGIHLQGNRESYELTCMEAKVDLLESYHNIIRTLASPQTVDLALQVVFQVFEVSVPSVSSPVPFLHTGLNDDLNRVVGIVNLCGGVLSSDDPRLEVITAQLGPTATKSDLGALSILPAPVSNKPLPPTRIDKGKGKLVTTDEVELDPELESLVTQVLEIFPEQDPATVRAALQIPKFNRSAEAVINELAEGNQLPAYAPPPEKPAKSVLVERRNVFDDEEMDYSRLRIGKKRSENADSVLNDKSFIAAQKAEILRRAAEVSDAESEWKSDEEKRPTAVAFFDDDDEYGGGGVVNDGEATSESDSEDEGPETVLELAWLEDSQVFERDAETRRSKTRADLKVATGMSDEQIEGWKVMLERDPRRQAKIRQKHEFKGNQNYLPPAQQIDAPRGRGRGGGGRGRGGRGGGRGRGRGGASDGGAGPSGGDAARDRAHKDKNKAHHANHDRKRGHDKKMVRGGFAG